MLIMGTALVFGTALLTPGLALVDFVGADDFIGMSRVIQDNMALSFLTSTLGVLGYVLQLLGLVALRQVVKGESLHETIAGFGVVTLELGVFISIIDRAALYTATHSLAYGIGAGTGPDQSQLLEFISVLLLKVQAGLSLMGFYAFLLGIIGLGAGLLGRIRSTSFRVVAVLMMASSLVSLVFVAVISPLYGLAALFFLVFALSVNLGNVYLVMLGFGLLRGRTELS